MVAKIGLPLLLSSFVTLAQAQPAPATVLDFPMVGVGFDQTFQVNVATMNACALQFAVYDSNGVNIGSQSSGAGTGTVTFHSFPITNFVKIPRQLAELRAVVTLVPPPTVAACKAQGTVEIYNNFTHVTSVVAPQLPAVQAGSPFFGLGPVGAGEFQTIRLNVLAHPPQPCFGILGFVDSNGNPIGRTLPVSLNPGQAAFLDLPGALLPPSVFGRVEVLPVLTPLPGAVPGECVTSVEVYDQFTGWTHAFYPPGPAN